jgi:predicted MFS family arabinose efflux permease
MSELSLWKNRDFVLLFSGQTVSSIGSQVSYIAFPLLVLSLTGSPAQAGLMMALSTLAYVVWSIPAGVLADRWDRKKLMIICDIGRCVALVSIPLAYFFGALSIFQLYVVAFVEGSLAVFFMVAQLSSITKVVSKDDVSNAVSKTSVVDGSAALIGPPVGGFLFQAIGAFVPFLIDALSYLVSVVSLLFVRTNFQEERVKSSHSSYHDALDGIRWLWQHPLLKSLVMLTTAWSFVMSSHYLVVVLLARSLYVSSPGIGLIFSIAGFGMILGSFSAHWLQKRFAAGTLLMGSIVATTLVWPLYAFASSVYVFAIVVFFLFFIMPLYGVTMISYRLSQTPDDLQGRVNSVFRMIAYIGSAVGVLLGGLLLERLGVLTTVYAMFGGLLMLSAIAVSSKTLRTARI